MLIYNTLLSTVGLGSYLPYQLVHITAHVAAAAAVYVLLRSRNGVLPALGAAAILLLLESGYENLLWAFRIGFVGSAALGAWPQPVVSQPHGTTASTVARTGSLHG